MLIFRWETPNNRLPRFANTLMTPCLGGFIPSLLELGFFVFPFPCCTGMSQEVRKWLVNEL